MLVYSASDNLRLLDTRPLDGLQILRSVPIGWKPAVSIDNVVSFSAVPDKATRIDPSNDAAQSAIMKVEFLFQMTPSLSAEWCVIRTHMV